MSYFIEVLPTCVILWSPHKCKHLCSQSKWFVYVAPKYDPKMLPMRCKLPSVILLQWLMPWCMSANFNIISLKLLPMVADSRMRSRCFAMGMSSKAIHSMVVRGADVRSDMTWAVWNKKIKLQVTLIIVDYQRNKSNKKHNKQTNLFSLNVFYLTTLVHMIANKGLAMVRLSLYFMLL